MMICVLMGPVRCTATMLLVASELPSVLAQVVKSSNVTQSTMNDCTSNNFDSPLCGSIHSTCAVITTAVDGTLSPCVLPQCVGHPHELDDGLCVDAITDYCAKAPDYPICNLMGSPEPSQAPTSAAGDDDIDDAGGLNETGMGVAIGCGIVVLAAFIWLYAITKTRLRRPRVRGGRRDGEGKKKAPRFTVGSPMVFRDFFVFQLSVNGGKHSVTSNAGEA